MYLCKIGLGLVFLCLVVGVGARAQSGGAPDQAAFAQDRARSQGLAPAERARALKLFTDALGLWRAGDFDAAKVGFERGLGIDPGNGPANFYLGDILDRAGDKEGARQHYNRTMFFEPDSPEGLKAEVAIDKLPPPPLPPPALVPMTAGAQDCAECPRMVTIPAGRFMMGTPSGEHGQDDAESPQHAVSVPSFLLGTYDVTFAEWDACVAGSGCNGYRPDDGGWGRGQRPVINVNWNDVYAYIQWLSRKTGKPYRLPSEAEWEYAARAGTTTVYYWGNEIGKNNAACSGCGHYWEAKNQTVPVGQFRPNPFNLYDMAGNVRQRVEDCWKNNYSGAPADGTAWVSGCLHLPDLPDLRVERGSSYVMNIPATRMGIRQSARAGDRDNQSGFRVARTPGR